MRRRPAVVAGALFTQLKARVAFNVIIESLYMIYEPSLLQPLLFIADIMPVLVKCQFDLRLAIHFSSYILILLTWV